MLNQKKEKLQIEKINVKGGWLEIYLKDKFNVKPMYIEAKVLTDKIQSMLH